jgi:predicted nucleic acid-binding protein
LSFVLDASAALSWCFEDEATPDAQALLARAAGSHFIVPGLWLSEIANVLWMSERRRRVSAERVSALLALFASLDFEVDSPSPRVIFGPVLDIARREKLTIYDATYLELALRHRVPLASLDRDLCAAAERNAITLLAG